jgi:hypothetical protein
LKCWRFLRKLGTHGRRAFPARLLFLLLPGWINRQQQTVIEYLLEENRLLRAERGSRRLQLTDDQRRRLPVKGKTLGRRRLGGIAGIVTPDTILRWYRRLVAKKYAGSKKGVPDRPAPSRTSPPSWSVWRTRTLRGATRESAVR